MSIFYLTAIAAKPMLALEVNQNRKGNLRERWYAEKVDVFGDLAGPLWGNGTFRAGYGRPQLTDDKSHRHERQCHCRQNIILHSGGESRVSTSGFAIGSAVLAAERAGSAADSDRG